MGNQFYSKSAFTTCTVPQAQEKDFTENQRRGINDHPEENRTRNGSKTVLKHLVLAERATFVEEPLDKILSTVYHNDQSGILPVGYNVVEQAMWDQLCKIVIGKSLDAHIAKFLDNKAAADRPSKKLLASSSSLAPVTTFLQR